MKTVLEPKKAVTKPKTPFPTCEKSVPGFLGCALWSAPPSYPPRARCQREVLDAEKAEAARLVAEFREAERISADNDLGRRQAQLYDSSLNPAKRLTAEQIQVIHREITTCDHQKFLTAETNLHELRASALDLARTILTQLIASFDRELTEVALAAEAQLLAEDVPLENQGDWELWHNASVVRRHAWRELARNSLRYLSPENSIGACQWLCSGEENTPNVPWL
jgi:hypothetical protein